MFNKRILFLCQTSPRSIVLGIDGDVKEQKAKNFLAFESKTAHLFSLPGNWVIKAMGESVRSCSREALPVSMFNNTFERITEFPPPSRQNRSLQKSQKQENKKSLEEGCIFSEEFYTTCLKTQLEHIAKSTLFNNGIGQEHSLSTKNIEKILNDDTYR